MALNPKRFARPPWSSKFWDICSRKTEDGLTRDRRARGIENRITTYGGAGGRFGDYLCVDSAYRVGQKSLSKVVWTHPRARGGFTQPRTYFFGHICICTASMDVINLQKQNSPYLLPKFWSLIVTESISTSSARNERESERRSELSFRVLYCVSISRPPLIETPILLPSLHLSVIVDCFEFCFNLTKPEFVSVHLLFTL